MTLEIDPCLARSCGNGPDLWLGWKAWGGESRRGRENMGCSTS